MPSQCEQAVQEYKELQTLGEEFFGVYQEAKEVRDITKVKELIIGLEEKKKALEKKIFPIEELLNRFEKRSLDYIDKLLMDGVDNSIAQGLAGLDSDRAWQMRDRFFDDGTVDNDFIAQGLAGLDSDRAWQMREKLLKAGADKYFIARGLAGLDSDRAWQMREEFLKAGVSNIAQSLAGLDSDRAWEMRVNFLLNEGTVYKSNIALGLAGLDSDRAWKMRDDFFNDDTVSKGSIAQGLAGLDSDRAWKMREEFLKAGADKNSIAEGLAGLDSDRAWEMRDDFFDDETVNKSYIALGLAGLDSDRAWQMREKLLKAGASDGSVVRGLSGDYTTFVWRLRPKKEVYMLLKQ